MKLWTSASAIGLSATYLVAACSSPATDDNGYHPTTGGAATTAGSSGVSGSTATAGSGTAGSTPGTAGSGGTPATGGAGTTGGAATGGNTTGGATTAGAGGGGDGVETEIPCPANVQGHCSMGATYPTYPGYTLNLVEDFPVALDLEKDPVMTWSDGSPADGQTAFRKEQITFAGGKMLITAEPPAGCASKTTNAMCIAPYQSYGEAQAPGTQGSVVAMGVWSGELRSKFNNYRYGRYEAKFNAPLANPAQATANNSSGFLSTMFIFRTPKNVVWNEVDVELEPNFFNHYQGNMISHTFAMPYKNIGFNDVAGDAHTLDVAGPAGYAISQEHVYAFNWTPTKVEWFLDGTSIKSETTGIPTLSAKIMMNLWIFSGDHFGPSAMNQYPIKASYDYFRFYKLDTETKYPCAAPPGCLDAADHTTSSQNHPGETGL